MKKILTLLICLIFPLLLVGCGKPSPLHEDEIVSMLPYDLLHYSLDGIEYDVSGYIDIEIDRRKTDKDLDEIYAWVRSDDGVVKSEKYVYFTFKLWDNVGWQLDSFYEVSESFHAELPETLLELALMKICDIHDVYDYEYSQIQEEQTSYPSEQHIRYEYKVYCPSTYVQVERTYEVEFVFRDQNGQSGVKNSYIWDINMNETGVYEEWNITGPYGLYMDDYYCLQFSIEDVIGDTAIVSATSYGNAGRPDQYIHGTYVSEKINRRVSSGGILASDDLRTYKTYDGNTMNEVPAYRLFFRFGWQTWDIIFLPEKILARPDNFDYREIHTQINQYSQYYDQMLQ